MRSLGYLVVLAFSVTASVVTNPSCPPLPSALHASEQSSSELPESAVLIALGHDSKAMPLREFADRMQKLLQRQVVIYRQFESAGYASETGEWWERLSFERTTGVVEQAIRRAVDRYPGTKMIAFNLDSYDPTELFGPGGRAIQSYTNFEVRLLLGERRLFLATRWYSGGRELSLSEAEAFWRPVVKRMGISHCILYHLRSLKEALP
jgi:hypothetical protein